jgi:hypothetical protein
MTKKSCKDGLEALSDGMKRFYDEKYSLRLAKLPEMKSKRSAADKKASELIERMKPLQEELDEAFKIAEESNREIAELEHGQAAQAKEWVEFLVSIQDKIDAGRPFVVIAKGEAFNMESIAIKSRAGPGKYPNFSETALGDAECLFRCTIKPDGTVVDNRSGEEYSDVVIYKPVSRQEKSCGSIWLFNKST